ncbi:hypothetical protein ABIE67_008552 [Streptomyces sp. V4I8]
MQAPLIRVLGAIEIRDDVNSGLLRGAEPSALLTSLVLRPGRGVPLEPLTDGLWVGEPLRSAVDDLRSHAHLVRRHLPVSTPLVSHQGEYALLVGPDVVVHFVFARLVGRGWAAVAIDPSRPGELTTAALALWSADHATVRVERYGMPDGPLRMFGAGAHPQPAAGAGRPSPARGTEPGDGRLRAGAIRLPARAGHRPRALPGTASPTVHGGVMPRPARSLRAALGERTASSREAPCQAADGVSHPAGCCPRHLRRGQGPHCRIRRVPQRALRHGPRQSAPPAPAARRGGHIAVASTSWTSGPKARGLSTRSTLPGCGGGGVRSRPGTPERAPGAPAARR